MYAITFFYILYFLNTIIGGWLMKSKTYVDTKSNSL